MGAILGMGFPQAQVHTVHSTSALIFISGIFQIGEKKITRKTRQIAGCNNLLCVNDAL